DRDLPGFLHKNTLSENDVRTSRLVAALVNTGNQSLIIRDENGKYHFNGSFRNAGDVERAFDELKRDNRYKALVEAESQLILDFFENVFDHNAFTGRSGTFFAYEGLGSIYWHMVSKLLLATQEIFFQALENGESQSVLQSLAEAYYDIRQGIGFNKTPEVYGAFPTDPYSHTPAGQGAKQPGMTGQVKEECVTRIGELGVVIDQGVITFKPVLLRSKEILDEAGAFTYIDVAGERHVIKLPPGSLAFTFCQVPIIYHKADSENVTITYENGPSRSTPNNRLDLETSQHIFHRDGHIRVISVDITHTLD
ncbi:MAG: hypothetical protein P1S60_04775, partial [Anaerolineae bacterium]|nr:hypothetical protein [Anaerolineae bacterium]